MLRIFLRFKQIISNWVLCFKLLPILWNFRISSTNWKAYQKPGTIWFFCCLLLFAFCFFFANCWGQIVLRLLFYYALLVNFCTVLYFFCLNNLCSFSKWYAVFENLCFNFAFCFLQFWLWAARFYDVILLFCRRFSLFTLTLCAGSLSLFISLSLHSQFTL